MNQRTTIAEAIRLLEQARDSGIESCADVIKQSGTDEESHARFCTVQHVIAGLKAGLGGISTDEEVNEVINQQETITDVEHDLIIGWPPDD